MVSLARLFNITREHERLANGHWRVTVTPPPAAHFSPSSLTLTDAQYHRYQQWLQGGVLIQQALPDLSPGEREVLMTGISEKDWDREFNDEEDDE